jgi:hypothetical protein
MLTNDDRRFLRYMGISDQDGQDEVTAKLLAQYRDQSDQLTRERDEAWSYARVADFAIGFLVCTLVVLMLAIHFGR